ncbi:hypothetical protein [Spiroplasma clarkii]|uniref:hypothetical protein n=1 Tax=Spiroplasma clarkii TaxID=2139 RepID=UPI0011BA4F10|nr:hypothetical protein [Spiroplasma clarkii]
MSKVNNSVDKKELKARRKQHSKNLALAQKEEIRRTKDLHKILWSWLKKIYPIKKSLKLNLIN